MKKTILAIIICMATGTASAQLAQFANSGPTAQDLIDGNYIMETANGDLNKDGHNDLVIGVPEGIAIYFGNNDGYKLYNTYYCPSADIDTVKIQRTIDITSKGVLRVAIDMDINTTDKQGSAGLTHMLRYQDNDFYLIGGKLSGYYKDAYMGFSLNMLTNKLIVQDKHGNAISEPMDIPELPLSSLSEFGLASMGGLERYTVNISMNTMVFARDLFAVNILDQIAKMEDDKDYPTLNNRGGDQFVEKNFNDIHIWGKKEHQHFQFNWQHGPYDEDLDGYLDCFPLKDGSYFVMFTVVETGDYEHYLHHYYTFKDNVLTESDKYLPHPTINDFYTNADKFPKKVSAALTEEINTAEYTYDQDEQKLIIWLNPWMCDETGCELPDALKCFDRSGDSEDEYYTFPTIEYTWKDGQFVRNPDSKPRTEDLKYFK